MLQAESYHIYMQEVYSFKIFHISMTFVPLWLQHHHLSLSLPGHSKDFFYSHSCSPPILSPKTKIIPTLAILHHKHEEEDIMFTLASFENNWTIENFGCLYGRMWKFQKLWRTRIIPTLTTLQTWSRRGGHDARAGLPEALILISRRFGRLPEIATNGQ